MISAASSAAAAIRSRCWASVVAVVSLWPATSIPTSGAVIWGTRSVPLIPATICGGRSPAKVSTSARWMCPVSTSRTLGGSELPEAAWRVGFSTVTLVPLDSGRRPHIGLWASSQAFEPAIAWSAANWET
jgi:hypothetical protein